MDMQDFQDQTAEPYPLFTKEEYYEEIDHPWPAEDVEQHMKSRAFPRVLFMMIMIMIHGKEKKENQRSNRRGSLSPIQSLSVRNHHPGAIILHQPLTHLRLPETFNNV
jgi:hypothetical protein